MFGFTLFFTIKVLRLSHVCLGFSVFTLCRNLSWKGQLLWLHNKYSVMRTQWFKNKTNWKKPNKLNLERLVFRGASKLGYTWKKITLAIVPGKQHEWLLQLHDLRYRILLLLSSKMLKSEIWNKVWKYAHSWCGLVSCGNGYWSLKHLRPHQYQWVSTADEFEKCSIIWFGEDTALQS